MAEPEDTPNKAPDDTRSDIQSGDWLDRSAPAWSRPYLRLGRIDRPIGTWLLLIPCWWGLALATVSVVGPDPWDSLFYAVLFAIGSLVMRGAGCTWNDILDRDFDAKVARTATRPLPSGAVTLRGAYVFLGLQLLAGLAILSFFNTFTILLASASLILVAIYPLMKRITYWPQAFLGLTFNWGALVGWAAVTGSLELPAILIYAAGFFWTLGYDTIYAHQDKEDDVLIGVKSSALKLGDRTGIWLWIFYGIAVLLFDAAFLTAGVRWPAYILLLLAALHLAGQAARVKLDDPADCLARFKSNREAGLLVFAAIVSSGVTGV
jgi:4-hydroxybenzoate polyprenyltransferase